MAAELPINIKDIDQVAVKRYLSVPELLTALDDYILFADRALIPKLSELSKFIHKTQPDLKHGTLYRGFGNWGPQEDLGMDKLNVGESATFKSNDKVISTTTSLEIAEAFGPTVVEILPLDRAMSTLIISDELSYIISRRRNLDVSVTQKEVILLPPIGIKATVLQKKKKGLFW